jgi:RimJ/RimL family protein N-acetyltransferase
LCTPQHWQQVTEITKKERDFLQGSTLNWILSVIDIAHRTENGDVAIYGTFDADRLVGCIVVRALQENLIAEAAFCCVLPEYREKGLAKQLTLGITYAADQTSARLLFADAVTSHSSTQQFLDWTGFFPVGILPDFELFGTCESGVPEPATLVRYVRFCKGNDNKWLERMNNSKLNARAKKLANLVRELLLDGDPSGNVIEFSKLRKKAG